MKFMIKVGEYYELTDRALDLINSGFQFFTVSFAILFGLLTLHILVIIFKS